jgi:3-oxoacyl-[acyl-carrier protein] reductase
VRTVITGGRSSIAQVLAADRAARNDEVCLTASTAASRDALEAACRERQLAAACVVFDLAHPERAGSDVDAWLRQADALILVAATPVRALARFDAVPPGEVDAAIDADIKGNLHLLRLALPGMAARSFGRIVFVSSVSVAMGTPNYGPYCLTKSAIEGLVLNLAVDYGERNVLSNIVRLGVFKTGRNERYWRSPRYAARAAAAIPQGRLGEAEGIGEVFQPLLSPTQYINGSIITVSGGLPLVRTSVFRGQAAD